MLSFGIILIPLVVFGTSCIVQSQTPVFDTTSTNTEDSCDDRYPSRRRDDAPPTKLSYIFLVKIREKGGMTREFLQAIHPKLSYVNIYKRPSAESRGNLMQVIVQPKDRDDIYQFSHATKVYLNDVAYCLEYSNRSVLSYIL